MMHPIFEEEQKSFNENFLKEIAPKGKQIVVQVEINDEIITLESLEEAIAYFTALRQAMEFAGIGVDFYDKSEMIDCSTGEVLAKIRYFTEM